MISKIVKEPSANTFLSLCQRPSMDQSSLRALMDTVFDRVRKDGDIAIHSMTAEYDKVVLKDVRVSHAEIARAKAKVPQALKDAIQIAKDNISAFHSAQMRSDIIVETSKGVRCEQRSIPINTVGLYIPGGTAPLFSTVLMLAIPAQLAGCQKIVMCSPPMADGSIHAATLYAADLCGVHEIFAVGGAQAVAAMTFGTQSITSVDKIYGPGNQYVTAAKVRAQEDGVAIDMPAGPSELLVYADETAVPAYVAADLLSQAEHGPDSQVVLVTKEQAIVDAVTVELSRQVEFLPRREIVLQALVSSLAIVLKDRDSAFDFINAYAPEHLIIASENPEHYCDLIKNAGSVFLGNMCPESAGDYASGTNHTLPTSGWARSHSGVNLDSFTKKITFQSITQQGIEGLADTIVTMADAEQLQAHANAVRIRVSSTKDYRK